MISSSFKVLLNLLLDASLNQKGPKGEFVVVIYSEPYAVIEYEGVKLRREAKEHAATRIFNAQQSPFKGLVFFASFFTMKKMKSPQGLNDAFMKKDNFPLKISKNLPYGIIIEPYTFSSIIEF